MVFYGHATTLACLRPADMRTTCSTAIAREGENGTGPILTRWEVFDNLWACLVPQESLRAEWCFMFSTGVLRMQVFEKAGDYEAFERVLKETLEEAQMRVCAVLSDAQPLAYTPLARA